MDRNVLLCDPEGFILHLLQHAGIFIHRIANLECCLNSCMCYFCVCSCMHPCLICCTIQCMLVHSSRGTNQYTITTMCSSDANCWSRVLAPKTFFVKIAFFITMINVAAWCKATTFAVVVSRNVATSHLKSLQTIVWHPKEASTFHCTVFTVFLAGSTH